MKTAKRQKKLVESQCSVCGKRFWAARPSKYCVDNSTCRVIAHQQRKSATKAAKSLMMDFEAYETYKGFIDRFPMLKDKVDTVFFDSGKDAMLLTIEIAWEVALKLRSN